MVLSSKEDVMIPYPKVKLLSFTRKTFQQLKGNFQNYLKNAMACVYLLIPAFSLKQPSSSLNMLSTFDAIPGVLSSEGSWWSRMRHEFRLFGVQSTRPDGVIAPFRQIVLELYEEFNMALAR